MTTVVSDVLRTARSQPIFSFYLVATLAVAVIVGLITINVIDLGMQHFGDPAHRTHDVAYGALFTTLVLGIALQLRRPERNVAAMVMALVPSASLLLAGLLADDVDRVLEFNPLRYAAAIAAVTTLLHPTGRTFFRSFRFRTINWPMVGLVAIAAIPLLAFAATNIRLQRDVTDAHTVMGHYGFMAALAYTILAVGLLASLNPIGWHTTGGVTALLAALLATTSLLYPDAASSVSTGWAIAALAWAAAFLAVTIRAPGYDHSPASATTDDRDPGAVARTRAGGA